MKHIKNFNESINEGILDRLKTPKFAKSKIPDEIINAVTQKLRPYNPEVSRGAPYAEWLESSTILDRVKITCQTKVGIIDVFLTLQKTKGMFKSNDLNFSYHYHTTGSWGVDVTRQYMSTTLNLSDLDGPKAADMAKRELKNTINYITNNQKTKKEFEDFYKGNIVSEVEDLLLDLSDMLGEYKMEKRSFGDSKGFLVTFDNIPDEFIKKSNSFYGGKYYKTSQNQIQLLTELNTLCDRLEEGYGLTLHYSLDGKCLKLIIIENKSKE